MRLARRAPFAIRPRLAPAAREPVAGWTVPGMRTGGSSASDPRRQKPCGSLTPGGILPWSPVQRRSVLHFRSGVASVAAAFALLSAGASVRDGWPVSPDEFARTPDAQTVVEAGSFDAGRLGIAIFHETNRVRQQLGLAPFEHLDALDRAADFQATTNALNQDASHHSAITSVATPFDRVQHVGLRPRIVAENAALVPLLALEPSHGFVERVTKEGSVLLDGATLREVRAHTYASLAASVVQQWVASPHHFTNIANPQLRYLGCSGRTTRVLSGLVMVACIQEFYTPLDRR